MRLHIPAIALIALAAPAYGGPIAYAICQGGCAGVVTACYAAAGAVFGTVAAAAAPPAIMACNTAWGTCQAACAATALIAPIP